MDSHQHQGKGWKTYARFGAMIATSTAFMYALMYLNTFRWAHIHFSEERLFMALIMGSMMAVVMLSFMLHMHRDKRVNTGIYVGSALLFALALYLVRSERTVEDA